MSFPAGAPGANPDHHDDGRYSRESPGGGLTGPEVTAETAALAAVETLARLGRRCGLRVTAGPAAVDLPEPPEEVRHLDGASARARLRELARPASGPAGELMHVRLLSGGEAAEAEPATGAGVLVTCRPTAAAITAAVDCDRADPWWRARTAAAEVFAEVLAALLADPRLPAAAAPGIGARSRALVLGPLAGRAVPYGPFVAIPTMIERQADLAPDRPAVTHLGRTLGYRELDELANGLAAALADRGVGRGDTVPVLMGNSLELVTGYLALMKLGAAFVPLDPAWPEARIATALDVLAPRLVLHAAHTAPPHHHPGRALEVAVDRIAPSPHRPGVPLRPDDPIYGIFTSGTTGTPKCAVNLHGGLTNRFRFMSRYFEPTADHVVLQNSRHTFDSSVWQLFWPLTIGGRTVVPPQDEFLDLEHTIAAIAAHGVTLTDFVPSIFNVVVAMVDGDPAALRRIASLRELVVGGEEINPRMVHRLRTLLPGLRVTNGYGPTETSIGMVFHPVQAADGDAVPLGRPIDNCYAVVVDDALRPLPPGATGEIVVGGACLGAGYRGDPARTGAVFVPNPFASVPGDRLYRTGDLGYYDAAGRLHFQGRADVQVKVGGVRIEPGEIEVAAEGVPGVRQAKVLAATAGGARALALFAAGDERLTEEALRERLTRVLPRTSLPRYYVVLAAMPLTDNGKVDRRALAEVLDRRLLGPPAAPAGPDDDGTAARVLRVLRSVLHQPALGPDDDVMRAGADSISAVAAVAALRAAFGVPVGVRDLFDQPRATALARLIDDRLARPAADTDDEALLRRDASAPAAFPAAPAPPSRAPGTVLVTGASGFVGARLVHELLERTDARVVCLVRAGEDAAALRRVREALAAQGLDGQRSAARLSAVAGDLTLPRLGLDAATWDRLARGCDALLHAGALVNFLYDYGAHRAPNVLGTREMLRLALDRRPKPLHHVSTLGVLEAEAARRGAVLPESVDLAEVAVPVSGYSRSKWAAERYLAGARRRGAVVTVLRLGEVMPADDGHPNPRALTHLLLSAFHRLGVCPNTDIRSDYTPVDYAAARMAAAVFDPDAWGRDLHVFHPESVCFAEVFSRFGTLVRRVPCTEFLARLREAAVRSGDRELNTLLALLPDTGDGGEAAAERMFGRLLTDNPRLFDKSACRRLERRQGLTDDWLGGPIAAYRRYFDHHGGLLGPPGETRELQQAGA
ncbi:amino acid adenylation domain-containing protein [Allonocardiopsis opalescens]|uniref:Amino acid adenylation domain-containing protein/thioester reductase-like protein n=1 Tax=Allonocardiopsis opalescens TaxID=1144618 RepID=A0A2T0QF33_9ACTN|nr:amino acid adenylation domain-containing protein [Allonocardiopsis opalescens]PRY02515.1 amino acid adenylation domain-containing protein/thioester reductase-like protein [Allonocardiopsis opalescens]